MKKILIVDDDAVFCKTVTDMLPKDEYTVVAAKDGAEGLTTFEKEKPDLVVLDIQMPNLDGIGFLKELRLKHPDAHTPVLIASNNSTLGAVSEGVALGVRGYIVKSEESLETIVNTITAALSDRA